MHSSFVREIARIDGQPSYLIGIRFFPDNDAERSAAAADQAKPVVAFTQSALDALASADPAHEYIDAFVYEGEFDALHLLQQKAAARNVKLGWRVLHEDQDPGLSETGIRGGVVGSR